MGKLAFLYAGQGSQHPGMGRDLYNAYPAFHPAFEEAEVDFDLKALCFDGPEDKLTQTRFTQPCMVAFAAGVTALLYERGIVPDYAAGLSLGEYSALHAAGALDAKTAVELAAFRGKAMEEAVGGRESGMAAVLMLDRETLDSVCREAAEGDVVEIANLNCPGQIVIAGDKGAVDRACALAMDRGARRCLPLKVSGPFHTSLMAPAGQALAKRFQTVAFQPMAFPVFFNCTGDVLQEGQTVPELLVRQVQQSVHMEDTIRRMAEKGVDRIVEIGPGRALSGFVKKTAPGIQTFPVETAEELEAASKALKGENP